MYSFYIKPEAKKAVERLAEARGESASETLRKLLSVGLQHASQLPAPPGPSGLAATRAKKADQ